MRFSGQKTDATMAQCRENSGSRRVVEGVLSGPSEGRNPRLRQKQSERSGERPKEIRSFFFCVWFSPGQNFSRVANEIKALFLGPGTWSVSGAAN